MESFTNNPHSIFGLTPDKDKSLLHLIPVPWEVTTSYGGGTSKGPEAIRLASPQIDLFDLDLGRAYEAGYYVEATDPQLEKENALLKGQAAVIVNHWNDTGELDPKLETQLAEINAGTTKMVESIYQKSQNIIQQNKIPAVIGGDHSSPLGLIQALGEKYQGDYGILHIDAHADLRVAYMGFTHSHASIMDNVLKLEHSPKTLVQVGIRDFCEEEFQYIEGDSRIHTYFDRQNKQKLFAGQSWQELCQSMIQKLPKNVYISFDIDGLSPEFCPSTGTPVPGGLSFDQAVYLIGELGRSGHKIIGFDLNEVAPGPTEWDANVGARILYQLCGWTLKTNQ